MIVFHQNENCLAYPHPPSSYEGGREQVGSSHFDGKTLILIGHYGSYKLVINEKALFCQKTSYHMKSPLKSFDRFWPTAL